MSAVFRHGRLRLYLLKLLDEAPRHGYEVIRLLQDRFMGVYAPSPGTIYPRLARLEEEGLVAREEANGRKIYRITDKGREELRARLDDLAELEEEITASVRDIAREVTEDVRETVRSLREELTWAARDLRERGHPDDATAPGQDPAPGQDQEPGQDPADPEHTGGTHEARRTAAAGSAAGRGTGEPEHDGLARMRAEAREARDRARDARAQARRARDEARRSGEEWQEPGQAWREYADLGHETGGWDEAPWSRWPGWRGWAAKGAPGCAPDAYRDLERLSRQFSRDLRHAATQAHAVSEEAVRDLRSILEETIERIRREVFMEHGEPKRRDGKRPDQGGSSP